MRYPKSEIRNPKSGIRNATVLFAILLAFVPALARAQSDIPAAINYQGKLTDNLGNPVPAGYYEMQFRIWDHPTQAGAGNYVWGRAFPLHVVTNGLYNILLSDDGGIVTSPGQPRVTDLRQAFAGTDRYLGLTVTSSPVGQVTTPVEISPRQQLVSAPYAMQAQNAIQASTSALATNAVNAASLGGIGAANYAQLGSGLSPSVVPAFSGPAP